MAKSSGKASSFWSSLPGILTVFGGTSGAVAALITALHSAGLFGRSTRAPVSPPQQESENFPKAISRLIDASRSKFTTIKGDAIGAGEWRATVTPPGARECVVRLRVEMNEYSCRCVMSETKDLTEIEKRYEKLVTDIGQTVPQSWSSGSRTSKGYVKEFKATEPPSGPSVAVLLGRKASDGYVLQLGFYPPGRK